MNRKVEVKAPSFPEAAANQPLEVKPGVRWQVMGGDAGHWRVGVYSPPETRASDCAELERHDCPEYFHLLSGRMTLLIKDGPQVREVPLSPGRPVLVTAPHSGFCPDGPHGGVALVVERDLFSTEYRLPGDW
ncbi:MAG TPA: hypothetical protein VGK67_23970 [Myxococcales bacterium]